MSFLARRAVTASSRRTFTTSARRFAADEGSLETQQKKNPELMILGGIMVATLGGAGYYFGASPNKSTEKSPVSQAGMPWETGSGGGKYQYHPGGDPANAPKDAPSALNSSIVPAAELPKELHDLFNKFGKE